MSAVTASVAVDPYRSATNAPRWRYLHHVNPLAKLAAPLIPIMFVVLTTDLATPLSLIVFAYAVLLTGAVLTRWLRIALFIVVPVSIALVAIGLAAWTDPSSVPEHGTTLATIGNWSFTTGMLAVGLSSAMRIGAMFVLAFVTGVATAGPDLIRAAVRYLHIPYRMGYAALAAYRFIPRFRHELGVIRAAHRVRGRGAGRGPFAAIARGWGYVLPLMAGAIRHAERVALAMDSRAFGAYPTRTERHVVPWRWTDWAFIAGFLAVCAAIFVVFWPL